MNEPKTAQDPSMEEILASIRRIISEDGTPEDEGADGGGNDCADGENCVAPLESEWAKLQQEIEK